MVDTLDTATDGYLGTLQDSGGKSCGTGYNQVTHPGDPDLNNGYVTATGSFNGITVFWSLPADSHAVGNVKVWRSSSSSFLTASQIATSQGSSYFDSADGISSERTYYYWVQLVSINGTVGNVLGPASAKMRPTISQVLEMLEGQVSSTLLAGDLRTELNGIGQLDYKLNQEIAARVGAEDLLTDLYSGLQDQLQQQGTLLFNEVRTRQTEVQAAIVKAEGIGATLDNQIGLIVDEQGVILNAIGDETKPGSIVYRISRTELTVGNQAAAIEESSKVLNGYTDAEGNYVEGLAAQYMVKTDVNGFVAGFGLYNDGQDSQFIVNANTFAVGVPGAAGQGRYPFIVRTNPNDNTSYVAFNSDVFIDNGAINNAMIGNYIQTDGWDGWNGTSSGWYLNKNGQFQIRGTDGQVLIKTTGSSTTGAAFETQPTDWEDITNDSGTKPANNADVTREEQFQPHIGWTFNGTSEGWAAPSDWYTASAADYWRARRPNNYSYSRFTGPSIINDANQYFFRGSDAKVVRLRLRVYGFSKEYWNPVMDWRTTSANYFTKEQQIGIVGSTPFPGNGIPFTLEFDVSNYPTWTGRTITDISFSMGTNPYGDARIDWIAIGDFGASMTRIDLNTIGQRMDPSVIDGIYIKNLAVDTLKIKDAAVTIPEGVRFNYNDNVGTNWTTLKELVIDWREANISPSLTSPQAFIMSATVQILGGNYGGAATGPQAGVNLRFQYDSYTSSGRIAESDGTNLAGVSLLYGEGDSLALTGYIVQGNQYAAYAKIKLQAQTTTGTRGITNSSFFVLGAKK